MTGAHYFVMAPGYGEFLHNRPQIVSGRENRTNFFVQFYLLAFTDNYTSSQKNTFLCSNDTDIPKPVTEHWHNTKPASMIC